MNKRILLLLSILMISLGTVALIKANETTNWEQNTDLEVANPLNLEVWENERDDGGYYTIVDEEGNVLDKMSRVVYIGDELIAADNNHYRVEKIVGDTATAKKIAEDVLADYEKIVKTALKEQTIPVQAKNESIGLYHTHSAESYVPTEGTDSIPGDGGIIKVGDKIAKKLEERGINVVHSKTPHEPRDANAYHRSRRTALELLKKGPATIIDVHRDGIPDPNFYSEEIAGNAATSIRLVVGRQNQNMQANLDFAKKVKAGMNEIYPGLVKSIFMAKGNYNQDLSPRSMLIEVGTHTNERSKAEVGGQLFADALPSVLGISTNVSPTETPEKTPASKGDWTSLWWIIGIVLVGGGLFLLISTGSLKGAKDKLKQFTSEEWTSHLGKSPETTSTANETKKKELKNKNP